MSQSFRSPSVFRLLVVASVAGFVISVLLLFAPRFAVEAADPFLRRTATVRAAERVGPAVVNITTETVVPAPNPFAGIFRSPQFGPFFRDIRPRPQQTRTIQNLGSGVIFDAEGHVLTNAHVVSAASRVWATLADGRQFETRLIGADPNNDLAVLAIEGAEDLPWVTPGTSSDLMVGEPVIAIGNPFGLENTVTTGVISATDRTVRGPDGSLFHGLMQTDASINPGNSGGPLLNAEGTLIGINTAVYTGGQGIGFAIPIDTAQRVVEELLEHGEVVPVWLGIQIQKLDPALREIMGLPDGMSGALVSGVRSESPAAVAGVVRGDVITSFEGRPFHSDEGAQRFLDLVETATPDQRLRLEVWREKQRFPLTVVAREFPHAVIFEMVEDILGTKLEPLADTGYAIVAVRTASRAARSGLRPGDRLVGLAGRALHDEDDLRRAVLSIRGRARVLLVVDRDGHRGQVWVSLV
ncbi:MAG: trypsin-like peptidase domain-containing protein [Myxococcota bacterium]